VEAVFGLVEHAAAWRLEDLVRDLEAVVHARLLDDLAPDVLGDRHGRPRRADGAAADIPLRLAVIGWDGASESSCAVRMLIDADVAGAFTEALRALAEAARDRV
jgi:hypothetical protein